MPFIKKISLPKLALIISFVALFMAFGSSNTPCSKIYASSGVCDTGDTLVTNTLQVQSGTAFKSTIDASGITADRNVVLLDEDSQTVPDSSGATSGDVLTAGVGGATSWVAPAGGGGHSFDSTYAKLSSASLTGTGNFDFTVTDVDLGSNVGTTGGYTSYTIPSDGYYIVLFQNDQGTTVNGSYNVNVVKNATDYYGCGNQEASHKFNCFAIFDATASDYLQFYYWSSVGSMYNYFDSTVYIYRLN